jgi:nitrile hydratase accessory protein
MTGARLDADGPAAPPRKNGELVFEAVWEGRLFGLTMALHEEGVFAWEEFRQRLIAAIAAWERGAGAATHGDPGAPDAPGWSYYRCWLAALEDLLGAKQICTGAEVETRTRALAARPPGHDHGR